MKIATLYAVCTFVVAVAATDIYYPRGGTDIYTRSVYSGETAIDTRDYWDQDMVDNVERELGARYLDPSYELSEREYAEVEARQVAQVAKLAIKGIMELIKSITSAIANDKDMRGKYTSTLVGKLSQAYPKFNFAVCHTDHKLDPKGKEHTDWGHIHHEVNVSFGKTIGYEIYWFKEGTFHRYGDGGYLNWAYSGNVLSTSNGGKDVVFGRR